MTARTVDIREKFRRAGGEDGLIDRLETQFGDVVPIAHWADWAIDFRKRKPVTNLNGLLVAKVREVASAAAPNLPRSQAERYAEAERYAAFYVQLYQLIAQQGLSPGQVADQLEAGRSGGFPLISHVTIDRLRLLGDRWPGS